MIRRWTPIAIFLRILFVCALFCFGPLFGSSFLALAPVNADPVVVNHVEGVTHGFLVLSDTAGETIAYGETVQDTKHGVVTARLTFHFKDGSLYDDTTVYTEHGVFRVLSDHLIEKGASFKQPTDQWIDARTGEFKAVTTDKGKEDSASKKLKIPADLANGIIYVIAKNIDPKAQSTTVSMLVGTPKPRVIKLVITPEGEQKYEIGDLHRTAIHYTIKFDLGGVTGAIAPVIGKQPKNMDIWIASEGTPTFLMVRGQFYQDGPIWTISLITPKW